MTTDLGMDSDQYSIALVVFFITVSCIEQRLEVGRSTEIQTDIDLIS
jgi:hypothetical protein